MIKDFSEEIELLKPDLKKYRLAGFGFMILNLLYLVIAWWKLPPVDLAMSKVVYGGFLALIALILLLTPLIFRGNKMLVQVLTFVYGGRAAFSIYFLISGDVFPAVPYLLPCVILTFYLLGRAAWGWW